MSYADQRLDKAGMRLLKTPDYNDNQTVKITTPLRIPASQWVARADPLTSMRITDTV